MKKIFFIRHGKATHERMPDEERFLTEKGIKRTHKRAKQLKEQGIHPDLIISSPAKRALQTAEILANELNYPIEEIQIKKNFYFEPEELVVNEIYALPNDKNTVFFVGHNPLWTDLANEYVSSDIWHLRTSGVAGAAFETEDWAEIETAKKSKAYIIN